jgi:hypothetical protein
MNDPKRFSSEQRIDAIITLLSTLPLDVLEAHHKKLSDELNQTLEIRGKSYKQLVEEKVESYRQMFADPKRAHPKAFRKERLRPYLTGEKIADEATLISLAQDNVSQALGDPAEHKYLADLIALAKQLPAERKLSPDDISLFKNTTFLEYLIERQQLLLDFALHFGGRSQNEVETSTGQKWDDKNFNEVSGLMEQASIELARTDQVPLSALTKALSAMENGAYLLGVGPDPQARSERAK